MFHVKHMVGIEMTVSRETVVTPVIGRDLFHVKRMKIYHKYPEVSAV